MTTERQITGLLNGKRVVATVRPSERPDHNICTVTITHRFEPGEFNRLFSDLAARANWAEVWRAVRSGQPNPPLFCNPLLWAKARDLRYIRHDDLAGKLDGEVYREQQRRRAKRWVRSMVPFFKGWAS